MYKIIYTDLKSKTQKIICEHNYQLDANELCKIAAESFVLEREGNKYLTKPIWKKPEIIKQGFYIIAGKTDFNKKYKIYQKFRNSLLYTGELVKIGYFQCICVNSKINEIEPKKNDNFDLADDFNDVLLQMKNHARYLKYFQLLEESN